MGGRAREGAVIEEDFGDGGGDCDVDAGGGWVEGVCGGCGRWERGGMKKKMGEEEDGEE